LRIGNIVRLDTVLRFENWCELISPIDENGNNIHRCKKSMGIEEITLPSLDCSMNSIIGTGECLRPEKWQQLASIECANKSLTLNNSIMTLDWCGLSAFRGIEFVCCPTKKLAENDYETSVDEQDETNLAEDDSIPEPINSHRRIIAMSLATRKSVDKKNFTSNHQSSLGEPTWMEDYRRWNTDPAYFAGQTEIIDQHSFIFVVHLDDEDINDNQLSAVPRSAEQTRFSKERDAFRRKYKEQIDQLRSRWQQRQNEIQLLAKRNASEAQRQYETSDIEFRQDYDFIKQSASRERTRLNEIHETHLDTAVNAAKSQANEKLIQAWGETPLKVDNHPRLRHCSFIHSSTQFAYLSEGHERSIGAVYVYLTSV
jgi:hypothetical protein